MVQIEVDRERAELAADAMWEAGPSAVLEVDLPDDRVRLTADVAEPSSIAADWGAVVLALDDDAYLDAWRTWAAPVRAGRRVVLVPAWVLPPGAGEGDLVALIDPGRAFGSGSHESTRLAVAALEDVVHEGDRVLDVGCGSGALSVVACLLGAESATAIDIEQSAVDATLVNASANGVAERVTAGLAPLDEIGGAFDVVVANIGGWVLFDLADALRARLVEGGQLILSGVVEDRVAPLVAAFPGCTEQSRRTEAGWAAVVLTASSAGPRRRR